MSMTKLDVYLRSPSVPPVAGTRFMPSRVPSSPELGVRVAWWLVAAGMLLGAVVGLWSFGGPVPAPSGFESYSDVPRRLLRLAHIAMIALPVLYLEYVRHAEGLAPEKRALGSRLMLVGMTLLPAALAVSAFVPEALYALPIPVTCLTFGVLLLAFALTRNAGARAP